MGVLNLFRAEPGEPAEPDRGVARRWPTSPPSASCSTAPPGDAAATQLRCDGGAGDHLEPVAVGPVQVVSQRHGQRADLFRGSIAWSRRPLPG